MNNVKKAAAYISRDVLLPLLALCAAAGVFTHAYLPERAERMRLEREVMRARERIHTLSRRIALLDLSRRELEAEEPEAVLAAIREVLRLDADSGYVLSAEHGPAGENAGREP